MSNLGTTRILYEMKSNGGDADEVVITMEGNECDLAVAVANLVNQMRDRCGLSIERFATVLPTLCLMQDAKMRSSAVFDLAQIRKKESGGGDHG